MTDKATETSKTYGDEASPGATVEPQVDKEHDPIFSVSTAVQPLIPFGVDDTLYHLKTIDHLTPDEEAALRRMFRVYVQLNDKFPKSRTHMEANKIQGRLADVTADIVCHMSDVPRDITDLLPKSARIKIISEMQPDAMQDDADTLSDAELGLI